MGKQGTRNRNFVYGTYDALPEDIVNLISAGVEKYVHQEDFTESAALSTLQNHQDVLFAKSIMEDIGGPAFMASQFYETAPLGHEYYKVILALYTRKSLQQMLMEVQERQI